MALTYEPTASGKAYGPTTIDLTPTAGDLLVALIAAQSTPVASTVSGGSDTWVNDGTVYTVGSTYLKLCYCLSATGGATTYTLNNPPTTDDGWVILCFRGATTWNIDQGPTGAVATGYTTTWTSGSITPMAAASVVVGVFADLTADLTGWDSGWTAALANANHYDSTAYQILAASAEKAASGTTAGSSTWGAIIANFYDSAGAGVATPGLLTLHAG